MVVRAFAGLVESAVLSRRAAGLVVSQCARWNLACHLSETTVGSALGTLGVEAAELGNTGGREG